MGANTKAHEIHKISGIHTQKKKLCKMINPGTVWQKQYGKHGKYNSFLAMCLQPIGVLWWYCLLFTKSQNTNVVSAVLHNLAGNTRCTQQLWFKDNGEIMCVFVLRMARRIEMFCQNWSQANLPGFQVHFYVDTGFAIGLLCLCVFIELCKHLVKCASILSMN